MIENWRTSRWLMIIIGTALTALSFADALSQWFYVSDSMTAVGAIEIRLFQSLAGLLASTDRSFSAWAVAAIWSLTPLTVAVSIFRIGTIREDTSDLPRLVIARLNKLSRLLIFAVVVRAACGGALVWLAKDFDVDVAVNIIADEFLWATLVFVSIERMTHLLMKSDRL